MNGLAELSLLTRVPAEELDGIITHLAAAHERGAMNDLIGDALARKQLTELSKTYEVGRKARRRGAKGTPVKARAPRKTGKHWVQDLGKP